MLAHLRTAPRRCLELIQANIPPASAVEQEAFLQEARTITASFRATPGEPGQKSGPGCSSAGPSPPGRSPSASAISSSPASPQLGHFATGRSASARKRSHRPWCLAPPTGGAPFSHSAGNYIKGRPFSHDTFHHPPTPPSSHPPTGGAPFAHAHATRKHNGTGPRSNDRATAILSLSLYNYIYIYIHINM